MFSDYYRLKGWEMRSLWNKVLNVILELISVPYWDSLTSIHYDKKERRIIIGIILGLLVVGVIIIVLIEMYLSP